MAATDLSHVSEEEENYLRMNLLLFSISPRAVRTLFDKEFHPSHLGTSIKQEYGKLLNLKKKRIINAEQWKLLFSSGGSLNSSTFDVTLMAAIIRNLTKLPPPTGGYDDLPKSTDIIPTADLARIKYYRNVLAHNDDGKIKTSFFTTAWEDISGAVGRLGGSSMEEECNDLRSKHLDQSTVPWNIRVQISQMLDQWRNNDNNFVKTTAATEVLECTRENSCVTITASSGVGKTAILQHTVLKMEEEGYDILVVTNPQEIVKFYDPNKKTVFVIDDFCGTYSINPSDVQNWEAVLEQIKELIQNNLTKIIVACRLQVYNDEKFKSLSIFRINVCNLLSENLKLSQTEKRLIAEKYLNIECSDIIQYSDLFDCFPLLCKLYHDNPKLNIKDFFQNPFSVYETEVKQLKTNGLFGKYCALALCVIFNNEIEEEILTAYIKKETRTIIENTFEACRLNKGTSMLTLMDELDSLEYTFIKKELGVYKTVHDKLFDFLSFYFGKKMTQCLIKNAHSEFISERFLLEKEEDMDQFTIIVPPKYHQMYIQRMVDDWNSGRVTDVFYNKNMNNLKFRQRYLSYLNTFDISYQRKLANTCDFVSKDSVLVQCCFIGDISLIEWCLFNCVDVNMCRYDGGSPLFVSSQKGDPRIVKLLLDNMAEINMCTKNETSPLFKACQKNHKDVVKMLLDYRADINKCTDDETSPLFVSCQEGYTNVVELLLEKKADINQCWKNETSPLFIACQNNHVAIANKLLVNKADINKCTDEGTSPLFIACQNNHVDIVKLLLDNKADINKCRNDQISPFFIACQEGYICIVRLLLEKKADINQCWNDEPSPLFTACQKNHVDIVKLLLDNKADINKSTDGEKSPLFIACLNNHVDIVKLLLNNNADINKCTDDEISPLFMACQEGYKDIVTLLIDKNADTNKCWKYETSPLLTACQNNHIDIVNLLLVNKADINKCTDDGISPLFVACQESNVDIVNILLKYQADTNKCTDDEISPLFIACQNNHVDIVNMLLDNKANKDKCTDEGISPLCIACQNNYLDIVNMLIDNKADINKCGENGLSPIFMASHNGNLDIVKILLANGANYNKCTSISDSLLSPEQIASKLGHYDIVSLICDHSRQNQSTSND